MTDTLGAECCSKILHDRFEVALLITIQVLMRKTAMAVSRPSLSRCCIRLPMCGLSNYAHVDITTTISNCLKNCCAMAHSPVFHCEEE